MRWRRAPLVLACRRHCTTVDVRQRAICSQDGQSVPPDDWLLAAATRQKNLLLEALLSSLQTIYKPIAQLGLCAYFSEKA